MTAVNIKNVSLTVGFLAIAFFYYWLQWSSEIPILGGDHAVYLLMADHWSPFGNLSPETTRAAMAYSYFPPLYPLILGLFGGTAEHVELAHAVTITFFMMSLAFFFMWAWRETKSSTQSFLLTAIFAFLPTTFLQSFGILSENLYLFLTLVAVWLLTKPRISLLQLYIASVVIGLALLARTAGIALVIAYVIYLFFHHRRQWILLTLLSLTPVLMWSGLKWMLGYDVEIGYLWMMTNALKTESPDHIFFSRFISEVHGVWVGWFRSFDPAPSLMTIIAASFIGVICIAGCLYRVYRKKFDSIYVVIYFGMIVLWLSSEDAVRYLYVIVPLFLLYGLQSIRYPVRVLTALKPAVLGYVYLVVITLTVLPEIGLLIQRLEMGADQENRQYAKSLYWYSTQDLDRARLKINAYKKFATAWRRISTTVRKDECIYSVDPTWLMLYSDRRSYSAPWVFTKNEFNNQANACRYVYVGSYMRPPFPPFYPKDYVIENGRVVLVDRMEDMKGRPVLGMLIEKSR